VVRAADDCHPLAARDAPLGARCRPRHCQFAGAREVRPTRLSAVRRWVMFEGTAPGIGKTTVAAALACELEGRGWTVDLFDERALFDRAETSTAAASFRTRRTATEAELLEGYRNLAGSDVDALIFPWSCPAMAEDLDWAAEQTALTQHARTVTEVVSVRFAPLLVWLDGPIDLAFSRAAASRGDRWLAREAADTPTDTRDLRSLAAAEHAARARAAGPRLRTAAVEGGWSVCDVDATRPQAQVVAAVVAAVTAKE
jgi:hypothetical protein